MCSQYNETKLVHGELYASDPDNTSVALQNEPRPSHEELYALDRDNISIALHNEPGPSYEELNHENLAIPLKKETRFDHEEVSQENITIPLNNENQKKDTTTSPKETADEDLPVTLKELFALSKQKHLPSPLSLRFEEHTEILDKNDNPEMSNADSDSGAWSEHNDRKMSRGGQDSDNNDPELDTAFEVMKSSIKNVDRPLLFEVVETSGQNSTGTDLYNSNYPCEGAGLNNMEALIKNIHITYTSIVKRSKQDHDKFNAWFAKVLSNNNRKSCKKRPQDLVEFFETLLFCLETINRIIYSGKEESEVPINKIIEHPFMEVF